MKLKKLSFLLLLFSLTACTKKPVNTETIAPLETISPAEETSTEASDNSKESDTVTNVDTIKEMGDGPELFILDQNETEETDESLTESTESKSESSETETTTSESAETTTSSDPVNEEDLTGQSPEDIDTQIVYETSAPNSSEQETLSQDEVEAYEDFQDAIDEYYRQKYGLTY